MLKFLLWLIFFYIVFRILTRFIFPLLLQNYIRKQQKKYRYRNEAPRENNQEKGKMKISIPRQGKDHQRAADHLGEYTDFEEEKVRETAHPGAQGRTGWAKSNNPDEPSDIGEKD